MKELGKGELGRGEQSRRRSESPDILRRTSSEKMRATDSIVQSIKQAYKRAIQQGKELPDKAKAFKRASVGGIDEGKYFEQRYKTEYNRIGLSTRVNVSTSIRLSERKSIHYQNSMNPKEGVITAITNYRNNDNDEWKSSGFGEKNAEIDRSLPNFVVLHQQYLGAARELGIKAEPLTRITRKNVSNPETMEALSGLVLPRKTETFTPDSDGYHAVLGTPNGHGAFYLVSKEYPDREITHIEVKRHAEENKMEYIHFYIDEKKV